MRKKIKQVFCMFSALVLMICCAVPAFADDIGTSYTTWNDTIKQNVFSCIPDSDKTDYYTVIAAPNGSGFTYTIIFCKSSSSITYFGNNLHCYVSKADYNAFACVLVTSENKPLFDDSATRWWSENGDYYDHDPYDYSGGQAKVIYSNVPVLNWEDKKTPVWEDPNAVPAPFTVTYTPELSLNMQNKIYYPSKGGANADENGLVAAENNNINLDIKLTPEFLKTFNEKDLGKAYGSGTYAVLCCLSKNLLNAGDDLQRFFDEDVVLYAMNHDGNYYKGQDDEKIKSDGSSSDDLNSNGTVDSFEPYLTLYQGRTPIYTIPRDGKLSVAFDLTSIDYKTHGLTDDSKLYVNVIGVFVKNNGHVIPQNGEKTEDTTSSTWLGSYAYQEDFTNLKTCEKIDDFVKSVDEETGKPETFKAYRVYSVISDPFSYEKFPDYVPKVYKDKDGNTYNPSTTKLKDLCNIPPSKVTDVDLAKGSDGVINDGSYMQPDDYNKYLDKKKINANFGSVDFTDIKSIFSTTGTYWDFLTAALSCLPSWFYAVFSAWFVLFLTIALIKLVLPT
ncbi:hypothetical protein DW015_00085 [Ruminococcus sp. AF37-20]|uniref:hypothetical protein n=1 Tax=Ruminococcus sp. AF37-20 TaxID=2293178 RepID=UPI000E4BFD7C|nr:hypothetical protein [Ruminococcus sp. AF37-20]RGF50119.1 hypothetical protein DW015_00085 [Ruminococcus sp. AF37-20]